MDQAKSEQSIGSQVLPAQSFPGRTAIGLFFQSLERGCGWSRTLYAEVVDLHQRILHQEASIPKSKVRRRKPLPGTLNQ